MFELVKLVKDLVSEELKIKVTMQMNKQDNNRKALNFQALVKKWEDNTERFQYIIIVQVLSTGLIFKMRTSTRHDSQKNLNFKSSTQIFYLR